MKKREKMNTSIYIKTITCKIYFLAGFVYIYVHILDGLSFGYFREYMLGWETFTSSLPEVRLFDFCSAAVCSICMNGLNFFFLLTCYSLTGIRS